MDNPILGAVSTSIAATTFITVINSSPNIFSFTINGGHASATVGTYTAQYTLSDG